MCCHVVGYTKQEHEQKIDSGTYVMVSISSDRIKVTLLFPAMFLVVEYRARPHEGRHPSQICTYFRSPSRSWKVLIAPLAETGFPFSVESQAEVLQGALVATIFSTA